MTGVARKPTITVDLTHHEGTRGPITGLAMTVDYNGGQMATVSIWELPAVSDAELERVVRDRLVQLADALREAAQSPQGIFWHPRERR